MRGILYKADLPRDLRVVKLVSEVLIAVAVLGTSDVVGVLGNVVVLLSNSESCLSAWLLGLMVNGDTLVDLVPI